MRFRTTEHVDARFAFSIWTGDLWVCVTGAVSPTARTLAPGAGEFSCTIPRLPLVVNDRRREDPDETGHDGGQHPSLLAHP